MKKFIAFALVLLLIFTLVVPASAATTMNWDWGKARQSIGNAAAQIVQEQQTEPTEIPETEYTVVEETVATVEETSAPELVVEPIHEKMQSWRDWLRTFMNRMHYGEG